MKKPTLKPLKLNTTTVLRLQRELEPARLADVAAAQRKQTIVTVDDLGTWACGAC